MLKGTVLYTPYNTIYGGYIYVKAPNSAWDIPDSEEMVSDLK